MFNLRSDWFFSLVSSPQWRISSYRVAITFPNRLLSKREERREREERERRERERVSKAQTFFSSSSELQREMERQKWGSRLM